MLNSSKRRDRFPAHASVSHQLNRHVACRRHTSGGDGSNEG